MIVPALEVTVYPEPPLATCGSSIKLIKSSVSSDAVVLSLHDTELSIAELRSQVVEHEPGSVMTAVMLQLESSTSVMVTVTFPAPADPVFNVNVVAVP